MLANQIPAPAAEVQALASALADVISALKSGQGALAAGEAALPDLMAAVAGISNIGADAQQAHNQAYLAWAVGQCFETP